MRSGLKLFLIALFALFLAACGRAPLQEQQAYVFGTRVEVLVVSAEPEQGRKAIAADADELAMAKDDRDCQAEFFRPEYLRVRSAAEQRFVDRNGELLDELAKLTGLG